LFAKLVIRVIGLCGGHWAWVRLARRTFHPSWRSVAGPGRAPQHRPAALLLVIVPARSLAPGLEQLRLPTFPPARSPCKTVESFSNLPPHPYIPFRALSALVSTQFPLISQR
jgi:hypothetical protein